MRGKKIARWPGRFWKPFDEDFHAWVPDWIDDHFLAFEGSRLATADEIASLAPDFSVLESRAVKSPGIGRGKGGGGRTRGLSKLRGEVIYFGSLAR